MSEIEKAPPAGVTGKDLVDWYKLQLDRQKLALDQSKLAFDRDKASYDQNFNHFRNLNDHLHRLPTLCTTIAGGIWFAAGIKDTLDPAMRFALMYLAGWFSLMLILVMIRMRDVMESYLEKIKEFNLPSFAGGKPKKPALPQFLDYSMVSLFAAMAGITVVLSWLAEFYLFWPSTWCSVWYGVATTVVLVLSLFAIIRMK